MVWIAWRLPEKGNQHERYLDGSWELAEARRSGVGAAGAGWSLAAGAVMGVVLVEAVVGPLPGFEAGVHVHPEDILCVALTGLGLMGLLGRRRLPLATAALLVLAGVVGIQLATGATEFGLAHAGNEARGVIHFLGGALCFGMAAPEGSRRALRVFGICAVLLAALAVGRWAAWRSTRPLGRHGKRWAAGSHGVCSAPRNADALPSGTAGGSVVAGAGAVHAAGDRLDRGGDGGGAHAPAAHGVGCRVCRRWVAVGADLSAAAGGMAVGDRRRLSGGADGIGGGRIRRADFGGVPGIAHGTDRPPQHAGLAQSRDGKRWSDSLRACGTGCSVSPPGAATSG